MAANLDARIFRQMFLAGANALNAKKDWINELNVFPVPDGDTGTNMTMTIMSAVKEVMAEETGTLNGLSRAMSFGALHGARGNSGVILSQLLRGFSKIAREKETLEISDISAAVSKAVESAYKAVMKPKEGTILTVAKAVAEKAEELKDSDDMEAFLKEAIAYGDEVLSKTPEMLPVLKQAGVVDSGGQGLMVILHGALDGFLGKETDFSLSDLTENTSAKEIQVDTSNIETSDIKFGYCTEFIILVSGGLSSEKERELKDFLLGIGDSVVCVADEGLVKVHVHSNEPGTVLQKALEFGELSRIKIDNMREEHRERLFKSEELEKAKAKEEAPKGPRKDTAFIAVSAGEGLSEIFRELQVDEIISGGQTMNPSTEDILLAIKNVNADHVFVLPNNKNIIMAANQAASLAEDTEVIVVPSRTICQGITCMMNYLPDLSSMENLEVMKEAMGMVKSIEVTYAIRDTEIDGVKIRKDDYMALSDHGILSDAPELFAAVREAVEKCVDDETSAVTLYYGEGVTEEEAVEMGEALSDIKKNAEVTVLPGGQPVYYYYISVE